MPNPANWAQLQRTIAGTRHAQFVRHLVKSFDLLFFVHVIIIYLHDISTFSFLLRALVQMVFLSPHLLKVRIPPQLNHRPIIGFVIATNAYCILRHAFHSFPHPVYATPTTFGAASSSSFSSASTNGSPSYTVHQSPRNILHGGLTIEFVGAPPFASAWPFLVLDTCVLALQLIVYALNFAEKDSDENGGGNDQQPRQSNTEEEEEEENSQIDNDREGYEQVQETARILREELQHGIDTDSGVRDAGEGPSSARPNITTQHSPTSRLSPPASLPLRPSSSSSSGPRPGDNIYESYSGNLNVRNIEVFHTIARSWTSHERYWEAHGGRPAPLTQTQQQRRQRRRRRRRRQAGGDLERGSAEESEDEEEGEGEEANGDNTSGRAQRRRARQEIERTLRFMQESVAALEGRAERRSGNGSERGSGSGTSAVSREELARIAEVLRAEGWGQPSVDGEGQVLDESGFDSSSSNSGSEEDDGDGRAAVTYGSTGETVAGQSGMWGSDESDDDLYAPRQASESDSVSVSVSDSSSSDEDQSGTGGHGSENNVLSSFMNSVIP